MADKFIQMAQRNAGNTGWDNLFPIDKFETAGGTATAITLTIPNLADGVSKTFIASASNNSVATTINGKSLYKPNTTTAPTLIPGKAYTVWYNASSSCFFIKASAEGNAVAEDVLAGKTFSNDTDSGLVGTLEGKQDPSDYMLNLPKDSNTILYTPIGFIENEGLWCISVSNYQSLDGKAYLFDGQGNIVNTLSLSTDFLCVFANKEYLLWNNNTSIVITDKNGTILYTISNSTNFNGHIQTACIKNSNVYVCTDTYIAKISFTGVLGYHQIIYYTKEFCIGTAKGVLIGNYYIDSGVVTPGLYYVDDDSGTVRPLRYKNGYNIFQLLTNALKI